MATHSQESKDKVRLTVECSAEQRTYIKMLAAKKNMTISELLLNSVKDVIPSRRNNKPNAESRKAMRDVDAGKNLSTYKTLDEFWADMGIDPNA